MIDLGTVGRTLIVIGAVILFAGVALLLASRIPFLDSLGRLPGDLVIRRGSATIYIPIVTSIVISLLLTLILNLILRK
jgi:hypothetical protein